MGNTHDLASKGDVEGIRKFLQKSASKVDKKNRDGQTALHCAAKGYDLLNAATENKVLSSSPPFFIPGCVHNWSVQLGSTRIRATAVPTW